MDQKLTKLKICPCDEKKKPDKSKTFEVLLNPSQFSHGYSINYDRTKTQGQLGSDLKFANINPETIDFEIVLDNTGVVKGSSDVKAQIEKLNDIVYTYNGKNHEPNYVRLLWGSLLFFGRLKTMSSTYTLFTPGGDPLRAKIKMTFAGFLSTQEEARRADRTSPDMTHIVQFNAGDSLPLLCHRIYDDATQYAAVARHNDITNFREIAPGTRIVFPPLR